MSFILYLIAAAIAAAALLAAYLMAKTALIVALLSLAALTGLYLCLTQQAREAIGQAPKVLAVAMPFAAWLLPNVWLLYGMMLLLIPVAATNRAQVVGLYLYTLMLLPGLDMSMQIGTLKLFEFGVHDALVVGATLFLLTRHSPQVRTPFALDRPFAILMLMLIVTHSRDTSVTHLMRVATNFTLDLILPYFVVTRGLRDRTDLQRVMLYLTAAGVVLSLILIYETTHSWPIYNVLIDRFEFVEHPSIKFRGSLLRAGGPFLEPTSVAMLVMFFAVACWMSRDAFVTRAAHIAVLTLLFIGLLPSQSRGAWIGLLTAMALADLHLGRFRETALKLGLVGLTTGGLFAAANSIPQLSQMLGKSGDSVETIDYRSHLLTRGLEEFWRSPVIGFPYPELLWRLDDLRQGEGIVDFVNAHLYFALVGGVVGLIIFDGVILYYLAKIWRARRSGADPASRRVDAFAFAVLGTPLQMLFFTSLGGRVQVFLIVSMAFAVVIARRQPAPAQDESPSAGPRVALASRPIPIPVRPTPIRANSSRQFRMPIFDRTNQP